MQLQPKRVFTLKNMALTEVQRKKILNDPDFKLLIGGATTDKTAGTFSERARALKSQVPQLEQPTQTEEQTGAFSQLLSGAGKGLLKTFRGTAELGERGLRATTKAILPKSMEEKLGIAEDEFETGAEKLIPEESITAETPLEQAGLTGEQIVEFFIPVPGLRGAKAIKGASKASKLGRAAVTGAEVTGRSALQSGEIGKGEIAAGVTAPIVGGVLSKTGEALFKQLPERFIKSALRARKADFKTGKAVSSVLENKKIGTANSLLSKSQEAMTKANNKIDDLIKQTGKIDKTKNIMQDIAKSDFAEQALIKAEDAKEIISKAVPQSRKLLNKESLSTKEINSLRKSIDKKLGDRFFLSSTQGSESKELLGAARNILSDKVKKDAPGTKELFNELSQEISFTDLLSKTAGRSSGNQIISFGDLFGAGIGGGIGGGPGAIAGVASRRALQSTPFLTGAGVTLNELNKAIPALQKLTPAERGVISQIFQKLFESK